MSNIKVALRVRPISNKEIELGSHVIVSVDEDCLSLTDIKVDRVKGHGDSRERNRHFIFDYCYDCTKVEGQISHNDAQYKIFKDLGSEILEALLEGYNCCIFAYGQTGSGKTYTLMGEPNEIGLIPRFCEVLFDHTYNMVLNQVELSYSEIYNEKVLDLLNPSLTEKCNLRVREHPVNGPYVENLIHKRVESHKELQDLVEAGNRRRTVAATNVHELSSRSHAIFTLTIAQTKFINEIPIEVKSRVHMVDLAGSERLDKVNDSLYKGRIRETAKINKSLVTLGNVIKALADQHKLRKTRMDSRNNHHNTRGRIHDTAKKCRSIFVPYRNSILTYLLKDSLGGNSKTTMIATVTPSHIYYGETLSTLHFAQRAKRIVNMPRINEDCNIKVIVELRQEVERLKLMLAAAQNQTSTLDEIIYSNHASSLKSPNHKRRNSIASLSRPMENMTKKHFGPKISEKFDAGCNATKYDDEISVLNGSTCEATNSKISDNNQDDIQKLTKFIDSIQKIRNQLQLELEYTKKRLEYELSQNNLVEQELQHIQKENSAECALSKKYNDQLMSNENHSFKTSEITPSKILRKDISDQDIHEYEEILQQKIKECDDKIISFQQHLSYIKAESKGCDKMIPITNPSYQNSDNTLINNNLIYENGIKSSSSKDFQNSPILHESGIGRNLLDHSMYIIGDSLSDMSADSLNCMNSNLDLSISSKSTLSNSSILDISTSIDFHNHFQCNFSNQKFIKPLRSSWSCSDLDICDDASDKEETPPVKNKLTKRSISTINVPLLCYLCLRNIGKNYVPSNSQLYRFNYGNFINQMFRFNCDKHKYFSIDCSNCFKNLDRFEKKLNDNLIAGFLRTCHIPANSLNCDTIELDDSGHYTFNSQGENAECCPDFESPITHVFHEHGNPGRPMTYDKCIQTDMQSTNMSCQTDYNLQRTFIDHTKLPFNHNLYTSDVETFEILPISDTINNTATEKYECRRRPTFSDTSSTDSSPHKLNLGDDMIFDSLNHCFKYPCLNSLNIHNDSVGRFPIDDSLLLDDEANFKCDQQRQLLKAEIDRILNYETTYDSSNSSNKHYRYNDYKYNDVEGDCGSSVFVDYAAMESYDFNDTIDYSYSREETASCQQRTLNDSKDELFRDDASEDSVTVVFLNPSNIGEISRLDGTSPYCRTHNLYSPQNSHFNLDVRENRTAHVKCEELNEMLDVCKTIEYSINALTRLVENKVQYLESQSGVDDIYNDTCHDILQSHEVIEQCRTFYNVHSSHPYKPMNYSSNKLSIELLEAKLHYNFGQSDLILNDLDPD